MHTEPDAPPAARYDEDFVGWTEAQSSAIRDGRWADIDVENLTEEIDSLGRSNKTEVRNRLRVLLVHLLKIEYQPERASRSWENTIGTQAFDINGVLESSPSLRRSMPEFVRAAYAAARKQAARETGLPIEQFPEQIAKPMQDRLDAILADYVTPS